MAVPMGKCCYGIPLRAENATGISRCTVRHGSVPIVYAGIELDSRLARLASTSLRPRGLARYSRRAHRQQLLKNSSSPSFSRVLEHGAR